MFLNHKERLMAAQSGRLSIITVSWYAMELRNDNRSDTLGVKGFDAIRVYSQPGADPISIIGTSIWGAAALRYET